MENSYKLWHTQFAAIPSPCKKTKPVYTGAQIKEHFPAHIIDTFYTGHGIIPANEIEDIEAPTPNECFVLRNESRSVLARYHAADNTFRRINKAKAYGIEPRNVEQHFALNALLNDHINLVTLTGKAGTGKTLLAIAAALEGRARYRQILIGRPVIPLSNRDMGFLPGDVASKLEPYMQPLFDNLGVIKDKFDNKDVKRTKIDDMLENEKIIITPLAYIRGRSLSRSFLIIDEAQNLTPHEIKTIITRAGDRTKIVLTGDLQQIDQPKLNKHSNGLQYLIERMQGQDLYAHISLTKGERSRLAEIATDLL